MNHLKKSTIVCVFVSVLTFLLPTARVAEAAALTCSWSIVASPNIGSLSAIAVVSANNAWAVGQSPNFEHWDGTSWSIVRGPHSGSLFGVRAISASDIWAVGSYYNSSSSTYQTLTEHWDGTSWTVVPSPNAGTYDILFGVRAASTSNVWAVGAARTPNGGSTSQALIEHWDGTSWSIVASPNPGSSTELDALAAVSASNIWAVGYSYIGSPSYSQALIEHWDGTSWSVTSSPTFGYGKLSAIAVISAHNIWAVGYADGSQLIEHWNGTGWKIVSSPSMPASSALYGLTVISAHNVWAVGYYISNDKLGFTSTLIEHWNGTSWKIVSSPNSAYYYNQLNAVARVPGTTQVWAVGSGDDASSIEYRC